MAGGDHEERSAPAPCEGRALHRRRWLAAAVALPVASLLGARRGEPADAPPFVIIVHPGNSTASAPREWVADAFLKRARDWSDGEAIRPVDLKADSPTRARFSDAVLRRSVAAVKSYWQQIIFSGRGVPPPELESDTAVVDYVLKNRGAIGYVAGGTPLRGARTLQVRE